MHSTGPSLPLPRFGASPAFRRQARPGRVDLWIARTASLRAGGEFLSPEELDSCSAFQRAGDQQRALLARTLLRETLSRYAPVPPQAWQFARGVHGKPEIATAGHERLRFNLSHAGGLVACAVTLDDEIGIDLEDATRECEVLELGEHVFTPEENSALRELAPGARQRRFFELWTLKEAYLKARGLGFALDPRCAGFRLGQRGRVSARFAPEAQDRSEDWWFALLDTVPGHLLALATKNGGRSASVRAFLVTPGDARIEELEPRMFAVSVPAARTRARLDLLCSPRVRG